MTCTLPFAGGAAMVLLRSAGLTCPTCKGPASYDWGPYASGEMRLWAECRGCGEEVYASVFSADVVRAADPDQPYIDAVRLILDKWPTPAERS